MLYREMEEEEYMHMENEDIINPEQTPMYESPMMQQQMYQNSMYENPMMQCPMQQNHMMQYQMDPQWMPQMHHMGCPMMSGMYNPSTYPPQMEMEEYELEEDFAENMERAPHDNNSNKHDNYHYHDGYHDHDHHDNHGHYPSHGYYPHGYSPYNPYYQNYYPLYNFNPLLIPLLFGRD
jgi:hypothetical protein